MSKEPINPWAEISRLRASLAAAEAKLADEVRHADALYAALDEVMTFTLEDFPNMDASHPKACVTPAYRRANVAGVAALKAHAARRTHDADCESEMDSQVYAMTPCGCAARRAGKAAVEREERAK